MIPSEVFDRALPPNRTWGDASCRKQVQQWAHRVGLSAQRYVSLNLPHRTLTGAFRSHGLAKRWLKLAARVANKALTKRSAAELALLKETP